MKTRFQTRVRAGACLLLSFVASMSAEADGTLDLAVRGQPAAMRIVLPRRRSASQRYAAEELAAYVEKLTGVRLETAGTGPLPRGVRAIRLATAQPGDGLGESGFRLQAKDGDLVITGSDERGCLYGVYELLERFGGVRWYASWCEKVPRLERLSVPADLDVTEKPAFAMRQPFWHDVRENDAFAARNKVNGFNHGKGRVDAKFGGDGFRFGGGLPSCHTFETLLPTKTYFKDHPEYFSLVKGKRTPGPRSQLCLTNPDVFRIVLSNLLARIRSDPGAKFYGVSQNDWLNYCECEKCKAVDDEEESHAGTMVRFVNALAAEVEKEFPDVLVETLAYQYTRKPPKKTRLRKNVVPCLCTIECDFAHPLATGTYKENVSFREDIRGWAAQTDQLYVWDYVTNFRHYMGTFPNGRVLQDNLRFFRDNGVKMIFEQGDYQGPHADFAELKAWLIAKLAWNPDQPVEPLLRDFFTGYYGKAADVIRADYDATAAAYAAKPDVKLSIYDDLDLAGLPEGYWNEAFARREAALKLAEADPEHAENIRNWAFTVAYTRAFRHHKLNVEKLSPADMEKTHRCAREALKAIDANYDWRLGEFGDSDVTHGRRHRAQIAALVPDCDEDLVRWPTILPLADGGEEAIARDARWLVTNTIVDSVAWCCTLVPEGGETPVDKASVYAARYRRMQPFLKGSGVRQGILFQATIGHGWTPGSPVGWQKIVARDGSSLYKFCPLGAEFKAYIAGQAKTLAALRPDFFMVDDDTRYITGVDGCFCPVHLAGFAARQGRADRPWTREQLAADLAKDSRLAEDWDRYLEDTMVPLMETIRAAFPKEIPGQFCCCCGDSHHAARMAAALSGPGHEPVVRINNSLYLNDSLRDPFLRRWGQAAWQINDLPEGTVALDEADPCPHTRYSMDATRLVHHIAMNVLQGCRGAKIWLTRLGNLHEVESGRAYRELLREKHGWMREIARLRLTRTGVVIPQPNVRSRLTPLWRTFDWGTAVFGRMGIPYRYGNPVARHEVVALNEDIVGYLTDGELEWYLEGACILDGSAAEALAKRGFAKMIGVKAKRREGISVSAEKFERETLWNGVAVAADLSDADAKAVPMSRYLNRRSGLSSETTDLGAGSLWFENAAGGRIAIVASHLVDGQNLWRTDYYNETRKRELVRILTKLGGGAMPGGAFYAGDAEILAVTGRAADGRRILVLDNLGLDDVRRPPLKFGVPVKDLRRLTDGGTWEPVAAESANGLIRPDVTLRTYRPEVLELR